MSTMIGAFRSALAATLAATLSAAFALVSASPAAAQASLCCPADIVTDGSVGPADLSRMFGQWGAAGDADLDGSGVVDGDDLAVLLDGWGDCPAPCLKTRVVGSVRFADGSAASGAVVMTEFGGVTVAASDGVFALVIDVPAEATDVNVMAMISAGSTEYAGEATASPIVLDGETLVGDIVLAPEGCIPGWLPTVGPAVGVPNGAIWTMTTADLGAGPMLFVAGSFTSIGGIPANNIAAWDGQTWRALGTGVNGGLEGFSPYVFTLKAWDDGSGPKLYVGGQFLFAGGAPAGGISRWNGTNWSSMGTGINLSEGWISALEVFDDGTGPALYVAGSFYTISGFNSPYLARWRNSTWSSTNGFFSNACYSLAVFDDGTGEKLYVGGLFSGLGPEQAAAIASWDGTDWRPVGTLGNDGTFTPAVEHMETIEIGSESRLYVNGYFRLPDGGEIIGPAYWTGKQWVQAGTGFYDVRGFEVLDNGSGPELYALGEVAPPKGGGPKQDGLYRWTGEAWEVIAPRLAGSYAIHSFDLGDGPEILVGGGFLTPVGSPLILNGLARWNGESLRTFGNSVDAPALTMLEVAGPNGPEIIVGGSFTSAGGVATPRIARWNGESWSALGSGLSGSVNALAMHDAGSGPQLYAGGTFTTTGGVVLNRVARWNGASWQPLGVGTNNAVNSVLSFDDGSGPKLYAAGTFTSAGGAAANRIARWDGLAWQPVGGGTNGAIEAMMAFDDGTGVKLYIAGSFSTAGGVATGGIARWDGASWGAVGAGITGTVRALAAHDDGTGVALYAGGTFTQAGGIPAARVARWDGTSWNAIGAGVGGIVRALSSFPVDGRDALFVGGDINSAGGQPATSLVYWDGSNWFNLGQGMTGTVNGLLRRSDGAALFVCGSFRRTPLGDAYFSRIGCSDD